MVIDAWAEIGYTIASKFLCCDDAFYTLLARFQLLLFRELLMSLKLTGAVFGLVAMLAVSNSGFAMGDAAAGEQKAQMCVACHGVAGDNTNPQFPVLAGQVPGYIENQLQAFKVGTRENAIMMGQSVGLSDQDMADIDAYYSAQSATPKSISADQVETAMLGEKVYRGGYRPFSIAACMSCHGPAGHGIPPRFPKVSGQHAAYLEQQLLAFKRGSRVNDVMNPIAFKLSEAQIRELSLYMSALK
jgi:cytochrome c553